MTPKTEKSPMRGFIAFNNAEDSEGFDFCDSASLVVLYPSLEKHRNLIFRLLVGQSVTFGILDIARNY